VNLAKCVFATDSVDFLCHRVSAAGISLLPKHADALQKLPVPTDVMQLQCFLGLINFYRPFLPGIAATLLPLTDALCGSPKTLEVTPAMPAYRCFGRPCRGGVAAAGGEGMVAAFIFLAETIACTEPLLYFRQRADRCFCCSTPLLFCARGSSVLHSDRPQTASDSHVMCVAALVGSTAAAVSLHHRVYV
jgi:hypothetical protein